MIELSISEVTIALLGGGVLGMIFFGGLKLTVEQLSNCKHPALLVIVSLMIRFFIVLSAMYWLITHIHWQALLVALLGFVYVRLVLTRFDINGQGNEH